MILQRDKLLSIILYHFWPGRLFLIEFILLLSLITLFYRMKVLLSFYGNPYLAWLVSQLQISLQFHVFFEENTGTTIVFPFTSYNTTMWRMLSQGIRLSFPQIFNLYICLLPSEHLIGLFRYAYEPCHFWSCPFFFFVWGSPISNQKFI